MKPALAESCERPTTVTEYANNPDWWWEQKIDGVRQLVVIDGDTITGRNRKGETIPLPHQTVEAFQPLAGDNRCWVFDGEYCEQVLYLFDMPVALHLVSPADPYEQRRELLEITYEKILVGHPHVQLLPVARTLEDKTALLTWVTENQCEGIMMKMREGRYTPGKRSPAMVKYKLTATIDVIILETWREGKRSCAVGVYDSNGQLLNIGSVTMTEERLAVAQPGQVMEVKYLYVGAGNRLYQPRFVRFRDDKSPEECTDDQMKVGCKVVATADDYRTERSK